jgi:hypothetical protein
MMRVQIDTEAGNQAIKDGELLGSLKTTVEQLHAEAAYFSLLDGARCAYFVFDLPQTSQLPPIAEPLFIRGKAKIDIFPVMNLDELTVGVHQAMAHLP